MTFYKKQNYRVDKRISGCQGMEMNRQHTALESEN